jgi:hypothetical protein
MFINFVKFLFHLTMGVVHLLELYLYLQVFYCTILFFYIFISPFCDVCNL